MLHVSVGGRAHTHIHVQTHARGTNLKGGWSVGICRGETEDRNTECLCLLRWRGNRRSTLNIPIRNKFVTLKKNPAVQPLPFLEYHVGVGDSSLYTRCSIYITFPLLYSHRQQGIVTKVVEKSGLQHLNFSFNND